MRHDEHYGRICMHVDIELAAEHIRRIGELLTIPRTHVIIAHDADWRDKNKGGPQFWPGKISY